MNWNVVDKNAETGLVSKNLIDEGLELSSSSFELAEIPKNRKKLGSHDHNQVGKEKIADVEPKPTKVSGRKPRIKLVGSPQKQAKRPDDLQPSLDHGCMTINFPKMSKKSQDFQN